jgi:uncharacterized protein
VITRPSRRTFLVACGSTLAGAGGLGLYVSRVEPHWLEFVKHRLPVRGLPAALAGKTLMQISDVHATVVDDAYVIESFKRAAALAPDIVAFTGDFITYRADAMSRARELYSHFPRGRLATIGILGNHDYGPGWSHPEIADQVADVVTSLGITVLRNQSTVIEGLHVAGFDDWWAHRFDLSAAIPGLPSGAPAIVLSHNPDTADLPGWGSFDGWILAGHTHGGQCKPPFLPPPVLPVRNKLYTSGDFDLPGGRRMYINRGVGHFLKVRFNVRPEITLHELQPEAQTE